MTHDTEFQRASHAEDPRRGADCESGAGDDAAYGHSAGNYVVAGFNE